MKKIIISLVIILLVGGGGYWWWTNRPVTTDTEPKDDVVPVTTTTTDETADAMNKPEEVIGKSVSGNDIVAYHFGTGDKELIFVGGIHGGYSWNTALVAYELVDYLTETPSAVPEGVRVTVIPVLNPDGLEKVVGTTGRFTKSDVSSSQETRIAGRFNANTVDLNRNFDCDWKTTGTWQSRSVSGGDKVFSEPESQAVRDYVVAHTPTAVVVWYSAAGGVFASSCYNGILPETLTLTNTYAKASGYKAYEEFDFYTITGDMVNWLASKNIPAISVLLTTHEDIEWVKNKAGITAILSHYAK